MSSQSLTEAELALLKDRQFLLTKKQIDAKVSALLLESQKALASSIKEQNLILPPGVSFNGRKIARGENHQDMPYWVSDFPAALGKDDIWDFRSLVWWGNEIIFSLLLKGKHRQNVKLNYSAAHGESLYFSLHNDPWQPDFADNQHCLITPTSEEQIASHFARHDFIKVIDKYPLSQINHLPEISVTSFEKILRVVRYLA